MSYSCVGDSDLAECSINDLDLILGDGLPEQISTEQPVSTLKYAPVVLGQTVSDELSGWYNASRDAFGQVRWRWTEFYEENEWNKSFLPAFAAGEGTGSDGRLQHDGFILGLFILGPDTYYPEHAHPAEEFYIILTGSPEFRKGEGEFSVQEDGAVVMHHTEVSHAIRTSNEPFYGIYGWRGEIRHKVGIDII